VLKSPEFFSIPCGNLFKDAVGRRKALTPTRYSNTLIKR